ncbi:MAG: hypothetical protein CMM98_02135 [Rickettsiales bacterium]|nr:hypothetical protein [Rickettsiales bacterium]
MKYLNFFNEHFIKKEKFRTIILLFLMLIGMVLETFSIGALVPLFSAFSDPNNFKDYSFFSQLSQREIIIYLTLGIFIVFSSKTIFMLVLSRMQANFSYSIMARISSTLFRFYSLPEYNLSSEKDTSETIRNIIREPSFLVGGILLPLFTILTEVFIIFGIIVLLLIFSPSATLYVLSFIVITTIILLRYTRPKLDGLGKEVQKYESKRIKQVTYSLSGAKDFVLVNLKEVFFNFFNSYTKSATSNLAKQAFYKQITRTLLEFFSIIAICGLILFLLTTGTNPSKILSLIGIYLVALFRILPAANKIIINLNTLSFNNASLQLIGIELNKLKDFKKTTKRIKQENKIIKNWNKISLEKINFSYPNEKDYIFKEFNLKINRNDFCMISGPSGSGKSTLVDIILGILKPSSGKLITSNNEKDFHGFCIDKDELAYVPQKTFLLDESILANIALQDYFEGNIDFNRIKKATQVACLDNFIGSLENGINHEVGEGGIALSGGQIQRIGIARALYRNPKLLILDESTSALDRNNEDNIMKNLLNFEDITLICISHSENILKYSSKVIKIG